MPAPLLSAWLRHWRWLPALLWMGVIYLASADAGSGESSGALTAWLLQALGLRLDPAAGLCVEHLLRKAGHLTEYAILASLVAWAIASGSPWRPSTLLQAWLIALGYAHSDEWHQAFVPHRGPAWTDVWIDATGAAAALLILTCGQVLQACRRPPAQGP